MRPSPSSPPEHLLEELATWHHSERTVLADLGYEGEREIMRLPIQGKRGGTRSIDTKTYNALLKVTFTALRHVSISPRRIGATTAAALVILYLEHHRTV